MKKTMMNLTLWRVVLGIALAWGTSLASGVLVTDTFDSYPGTAGNGWQSGWTGFGVSTQIQSAQPLQGGGNYLTVSSTGWGDKGIRRVMSSNGVPLQNSYVVEWNWRLETGRSLIATSNERLAFGVTSTDQIGTNADWGWLIGVVGGASNGNSNAAGNFYLYDNPTNVNGPFYDDLYLINSGLALEEGHTYAFRVEADNATKTYSAKIMDLDTGGSVEYNGLRYRNQTRPAASFDRLAFEYAWNNASGISWSIDNLVISPEPSRVLLFSLFLAFTVFKRSRP